MTQKEQWVSEYTELLEGNELQSQADKLVKIFENLLQELNIKASLTMRLKGLSSLKEKIKRNEMDSNPLYNSKNIVEVLDDIIGIRILCMKIVDEDKILQEIKKESVKLLENNEIDIVESVKKQPKSQKNGHQIYRIKGKINQKFMFELQIKSLANLFWGEMEHLLIYKNNKYLINSTYYKNEMSSIYKELEIIDDKLTYMEGIMTNDTEEYNIEEKKEILKRIMYLNLKNHFSVVQENEYLNNNHIFDAIANIVFKKQDKSKKRNKDMNIDDEYNKIFKNALSLFLDHKKTSFLLEQFDIVVIMNSIKITSEIQNAIFNIMKTKRNGWWYMFLILSIISYNKGKDSYTGQDIATTDLIVHFEANVKIMTDMIGIKLFGVGVQQIGSWNGENSEIINKIISLLIEKQMDSFSQNKDMRWTNEKFQKEYKYCSSSVINLVSKNIANEVYHEEYLENLEIIADSLVVILNDTCIERTDVKSYLDEIDIQFKKMNFLPLDLARGEAEKLTIKDIMSKII